jgi:hypothetical protein
VMTGAGWHVGIVGGMSDREYQGLVEVARGDERVLGLVLSGSRASEALVTEVSDWDVRLVVKDNALTECRAEFGTDRGERVEVVVFSLSGFEDAAAPGSDTEWDRYGYAHAKVVLDKLDGTIARLVAEKATPPPAASRHLATGALDGYINSYYRSLKNHRLGLDVESHLDAAESINHFLDTLFAIYGRVRPYNKYLRWELQSFPLEGGRWRPEPLLELIARIVRAGDPGDQRALFRSIEELAREQGFGDVVEGWEADFPLLYGAPTPSS